MASYPSSIVSLATHSDTTDTIFAADVNTPNAEIVAVETGLLNGFQHDLVPLNDDAKSLGSTSKRWLKGWFQDIDLDGTLTLATGLTVPSGGTGATTLTAHGVLLGEGTSAIAATAVGTTGQVLTGVTGADPTFQTPAAAPLFLLKQGSGTSTAAGATVVDSIAITGLTVKDTLLIYYTIESVTADTAVTTLFNVTDTIGLTTLCNVGGVVTAGATFVGTATVMPRQSGATAIASQSQSWNTLAATPASAGLRTAFTTAWTGSWTLGLRHAGVTATGTFSYTWSVYKVSGQ